MTQDEAFSVLLAYCNAMQTVMSIESSKDLAGLTIKLCPELRGPLCDAVIVEGLGTKPFPHNMTMQQWNQEVKDRWVMHKQICGDLT